jgi:hypothetical protein
MASDAFQWRGAGQQISAPRLSNYGIFTDARKHIDQYLQEQDKAKKLEEERARQDKLIANDRAFKELMQRKRFGHDEQLRRDNQAFQENMFNKKSDFEKDLQKQKIGHDEQMQKDRINGQITLENLRYSHSLGEIGARASKQKEVARYKAGLNKPIKGEKVGGIDLSKLVKYDVLGTTKKKIIDESIPLGDDYKNKVNEASKYFGDIKNYKDKLKEKGLSNSERKSLERKISLTKANALNSDSLEEYKKKLADKIRTREVVVPTKTRLNIEETTKNFSNLFVNSNLKGPQIKAAQDYLKRLSKEQDDTYSNTLEATKKALDSNVKNAQSYHDSLIKNGVDPKTAESSTKEKFKSAARYVQFY